MRRITCSPSAPGSSRTTRRPLEARRRGAARARRRLLDVRSRRSRGRLVEAEGNVVGGRAILRLKDVSGDQARARRSPGPVPEADRRHRRLARAGRGAAVPDLGARRGRQARVRQRRLCARGGGQGRRRCGPARRRAVRPRGARGAVPRPRRIGQPSRGRLPAIVAGTRRTFDVLAFPARRGSAGIAHRRHRSGELCAPRSSAWPRRTAAPSTSSRPASPSSAPTRGSASTTPPTARCGTSTPDFLDQGPTDSAVLDQLRAARKLPEEQDFRQWKAQLHEAYRALEAKEHTWHLPDGRTLRVATTPNPGRRRDLSVPRRHRRLDLERRYDALIKVQGETLDNLTEAVAVFASDGRLRLFNPVFARMWKLDPAALARAPAHRGGDRLVPGARRRQPALAVAARDRHRHRRPRAGDRPPRAPRRQRGRLRHRAAARTAPRW